MRSGVAGDNSKVVQKLFEDLESEQVSFSTAERKEYAQGLETQAELAQLEGERTEAPIALGTHRDAQYEPELRKYGGKAGVAIAEGVFRKSSVTAIEMLRAARVRDASGTAPPLGEALKTTALSLSAAGLNHEETLKFLEHYRSWWKRYSTQENQSIWTRLCDRLSNQVIAICHDAWSVEGQNDPLYLAISDATERARQMSGLALDAPITDVTLKGSQFLGCISNYIHTTNNRLGLIPAGESLVAELLLRGLAEDRTLAIIGKNRRFE